MPVRTGTRAAVPGGNPFIVAVMHTVAILVLDGVVPFDMAAPMQAFDWTRLPDGRRPYRVRLCAESPDVRTEGMALRIGVPVRTLSPAANGDDLARVPPVWVSPVSYSCAG
ncbi:hypothetical protein GCM10010421_63240 [Streptomyces glaucus]|uniref:Uncharacterized protein n=1 Tax=Streptomyces glaucus TaxID=284029 RepID=A0ABN3KII6_9ACTN